MRPSRRVATSRSSARIALNLTQLHPRHRGEVAQEQSRRCHEWCWPLRSTTTAATTGRPSGWSGRRSDQHLETLQIHTLQCAAICIWCRTVEDVALEIGEILGERIRVGRIVLLRLGEPAQPRRAQQRRDHCRLARRKHRGWADARDDLTRLQPVGRRDDVRAQVGERGLLPSLRNDRVDRARLIRRLEIHAHAADHRRDMAHITGPAAE